jgi:hypothetical protein
VPAQVNATLNKTGTLLFTTTASGPGSIYVVPSLWFEPFNCTASCSRSLSFVPDAVGTFPIDFDVTWIEKELSTRKSTRVVVVSGWDSAKDVQSVNDLLQSLEDQLSSLEGRGIQSPVSRKILDQAKSAPLVSFDDIVKVRGQLLKAQEFIQEAGGTKIQGGPGLPIGSIIIGFASLLVGAVALFIVFKHHELPERSLERNLTLGSRAYYPAQQYQGMVRPPATGPAGGRQP